MDTDNKKKGFFYLMPDKIFEGKECYADLEQIHSINRKYIGHLLEHRKASLRSPWLEKLAFKLGYCFNRIALPDFPIEKFEKSYKDKHFNLIESLYDTI